MKKTNKKTKLEKDVEKCQMMLDDLIVTKTKALVRAKRAEYWIKDTQEEYEKVVEDYNRSKNRLQNAFEVRRMSFWVTIIPEIIMFIKNPIKYIRFRPGTTSVMIEVYWSFKRIKKEWEDDFDFTEKKIDEDFKLVEETEKLINRFKNTLEVGKNLILKQKRRKK
jgi:hypothetical protein